MYFVFPKRSFSIADLFAVRYLWVVCNEDKCCVVTQRTADICVAWLVYFACLRSHVLCAYYNFESKQADSITLFGRRPNNKPYTKIFRGICIKFGDKMSHSQKLYLFTKTRKGKILNLRTVINGVHWGTNGRCPWLETN